MQFELSREQEFVRKMVREFEKENKMKKLFISCPMKGRTEENIRKSMEKMHKIAEMEYQIAGYQNVFNVTILNFILVDTESED